MAIFRGTSGNDYFAGLTTDDSIYGRFGDDALYGGDGSDNLDGGKGTDNLDGGEGFNILRGRQGNDSLIADGYAADSINILRGDKGDDTLTHAGSGYTRMEGGTGNDWASVYCGQYVNQSAEIFLGRGDDTVAFHSADAVAFSQTHVRDFQPGEDHIQLLAEESVAAPGFAFPRTLGTAELFSIMDSDGNGVLDGNDPHTSDFAFAFKLGEPEHGIGMWINGDALVIQLPPGHDALTAADFLM